MISYFSPRCFAIDFYELKYEKSASRMFAAIWKMMISSLAFLRRRWLVEACLHVR